QEHVRRAHRLFGWAAHLAVEAEQRDAVARIDLVRGLDHVVLLVTFDAMLRPERGGDVDPHCNERVERVGEVLRYRGRMRHERHALAFEGLPELRLCKQPVDPELHGLAGAASWAAKQAGA